jgi:uncharacterized cupredoxin-like copper-binding protein
LKTRLIVFFLTATQCFLVGCNLRNPPQRREPQDPFTTEQEPFPSPDRRNNDRNSDSNNDRNGNSDRNGNNGRNNDSDNDRNRGGNFDRDKRDDIERDQNQNPNRDRDRDRDRDNNGEKGGQRGYEKKHGVPGSTTNKVHVTAHEMSFRMSQSSVLPGKIDFLVTNTSKIPHEMNVIKTDLSVNKLPVINNGQLDKQKAGTLVGEINASELKTGTTKLLSLDLTPGNYLIISNLPGQFQAGMITQFTVK